jgi:hypothetical protein
MKLSFTLREKRRLRMFEIGVLLILLPRRDEVTGEWRKLHDEEIRVLLILLPRRDEVTGEWRKLHNEEIRVLLILLPRRDEVTGEWRKLHNEEINNLTQYCSGDQIEKNEMGVACSVYGGEVYTEFWWGNQKERITRKMQV